ncbi:MAG: hypothetical protein AAB323_01520 [Pseudomonadota bacterium]
MILTTLLGMMVGATATAVQAAPNTPDSSVVTEDRRTISGTAKSVIEANNYLADLAKNQTGSLGSAQLNIVLQNLQRISQALAAEKTTKDVRGEGWVSLLYTKPDVAVYKQWISEIEQAQANIDTKYKELKAIFDAKRKEEAAVAQQQPRTAESRPVIQKPPVDDFEAALAAFGQETPVTPHQQR